MGMKKAVRKGRPYARGFTIVETMIVLAITGGLFVMIAATMSGRQNTAEFNQAIQAARTQIQQVIDQVGEGFYPNLGFTCMAAGNNVSFALAAGDTQGTNDGCTFLGKVIQFQADQFVVYTVVGVQCTATSSSCAGPATAPFQNVNPTIVNVAGHQYAEFATTQAFEFGLTAVQSKTVFNGAPIGAVGFMMEPGALATGNNGGFASGTQQIDLMAIGPAVNLSTDPSAAVPRIETALQNPNTGNGDGVNPSSPVQICLASGGTNQSGLLSIGGAGRQLSVNVAIRDGRGC